MIAFKDVAVGAAIVFLLFTSYVLDVVVGTDIVNLRDVAVGAVIVLHYVAVCVVEVLLLLHTYMTWLFVL